MNFFQLLTTVFTGSRNGAARIRTAEDIREDEGFDLADPTTRARLGL